MLTLNRPAIIVSDEGRLDAEYHAVRWAHHRLLDFEDEHERVIDAAADQCAPGVVRCARLVAILSGRARRAERTSKGRWCPAPRPELLERLQARLSELREQRNADPRWKAALRWADEQVGEPKRVRRRRAKRPDQVKRRKSETDDAYGKRYALLTTDEPEDRYAAKLAAVPRDTRRDAARKAIYRERKCYWGSWNALLRSVDQARKTVIKQRAKGLPSELRRPKFGNPCSIAADPGGFRIVDRGSLWWTIEMRIGLDDEWVQLRAKCGNWHAIHENAKIATAKLTRRRDGNRWTYSLSLTVDMSKDTAALSPHGVVSFDWGHREHGHDNAIDGIRAFVWRGDDGASGEVLIPSECRRSLDEIDAMKGRLDEAFDARRQKLQLPDRNRYLYRRRIMQFGVRTEEESAWLSWEMRYERRIAKRRKRIVNLRRETYLRVVRELRGRYAVFAFEREAGWAIAREQKDEQTARRQRSNRDLATRYEFVELCERFGAEIITVPARNSTRECPDCGHLSENTADLLIACQGCGVVRDKDHGAARVILQRAKEALANRAA